MQVIVVAAFQVSDSVLDLRHYIMAPMEVQRDFFHILGHPDTLHHMRVFWVFINLMNTAFIQDQLSASQ